MEQIARAIRRNRHNEILKAFILGGITGIALMFSAMALATEAEMPIKATIIQCGTKVDAAIKCYSGEEACCGWEIVLPEVEPAGNDTDGQCVTPESTDDGEVINFE